ncbi:hypothetical protein HYV91_00615 [Candidatus Wolfebacteria bacterium]|nr:hypothetical protein [Candidatus Wolfebacteria bacterium]
MIRGNGITSNNNLSRFDDKEVAMDWFFGNPFLLLLFLFLLTCVLILVSGVAATVYDFCDSIRQRWWWPIKYRVIGRLAKWRERKR